MTPCALADRQALQAVLVEPKVGRHAALAAQAAAQRHRFEGAAQVVGPLMVRADELGRRAEVGAAELQRRGGRSG